MVIPIKNHSIDFVVIKNRLAPSPSDLLIGCILTTFSPSMVFSYSKQQLMGGSQPTLDVQSEYCTQWPSTSS